MADQDDRPAIRLNIASRQATLVRLEHELRLEQAKLAELDRRAAVKHSSGFSDEDLRKAAAVLLHKDSATFALREGQTDIMHSTLGDFDVVGMMRTGGGKTLTYMLPAFLANRDVPPGHLKARTVVVCPLTALGMQNMEEVQRLLGTEAAMHTPIGTGASKAADAVADSGSLELERGFSFRPKSAWQRQILESKNLEFIFTTPQFLAKSRDFRKTLVVLLSRGLYLRLVVDEAHCISFWGGSFSPEWALIGMYHEGIIAALPYAERWRRFPKLALSATLPPNVLRDVIESLRMDDEVVAIGDLDRPNLIYAVEHSSLGYNAAASAAFKRGGATALLLLLVQKALTKVAACSQVRTGDGMVFLSKTNHCNKIAKALSELGFRAAAYHARMPQAERDAVMQLWKEGEVQILICTDAAGLGINKLDVRFVIHGKYAKSYAEYLQQIGRAGRDGEPALCLAINDARLMLPMMPVTQLGSGTGAHEEFRRIVEYATFTYAGPEDFDTRAHCRREMLLRAMGCEYSASVAERHSRMCSPRWFINH